MGYVSTTAWRDLSDRHMYGAGDPFPYDGRELPAERYLELAGTQNKAGFALIKAVQDNPEEIPTEEPKPAKRGRRTQKKAD